MKSSFQKLPDVILALIISNYLDIKDIINLDSSFLNNTDRCVLHSAYLIIQEFTENIQKKKMNILMARWISKKTPNLIKLYLCDGDIIDADLIEIFESCQKIRELTITGGQYTDQGLSFILHQSTQLDTLKVMNNAFITSIAAAEPYHNLSSLTCIDLQGCSSAQDQLLIFISSFCHNLLTLSLGNCWSLTDAGLSSVIRSCRALVSLNLNQCSQFSDVSISEIPQYLPHMTTLDLSNCVDVTARTLTLISRSLLELRQLNLSGCGQATLDVYQHIAQLPQLIELRLCSITGSLSEAALYDIIQSLSLGCSRLQYLSLAGSAISDEVLNIFKDLTIFRSLQCLDLMEDDCSYFYPLPYYTISPDVVADICRTRLNQSLIQIDPNRYFCNRHFDSAIDEEDYEEDEDDVYDNVISYSQIPEYYFLSQPPSHDYEDDDYVDDWDI